MTAGERDRTGTRSRRRNTRSRTQSTAQTRACAAAHNNGHGNKWVLYLSDGLDGEGLLVMTRPDGTKVRVYLSATYTRVLYVIIRALQIDRASQSYADDGLDPDLQGRRRAERVGREVERLSRDANELAARTVIRYISKIRHLIKVACEEARVDPEQGNIIDSRRGWGYRLSVDIDVVYWGEQNNNDDGGGERTAA